MLSAKQAGMLCRILVLILIAAISCFLLAAKLPETGFIKDSVESVENSNNTVMRFSAATLSTSLAISALPDDFATPLAESLSDMNIYFVVVLIAIYLEKILLNEGLHLVFTYVIPAACLIGIISVLMKNSLVKSLAIRLGILGLAAALVVPYSTHLTDLVAANQYDYVEATITDTEDGSAKINEVMESGDDEKTVFERLSDIFQTAINGVSDLLMHFQNTIRKCMNSIAILILTNCLMPVMSFMILRWVLKETFALAIPLPPMKSHRRTHAEHEETEKELAATGE